MKLWTAIIVTAFICASPVLAQAPASGTQQKPPATQHQPGTIAQPAQQPGQAAPSASAKPSVAEKVDPAKEAAIRHLMEITQTSKLGDNISTYITNQVRGVMSRGLPPDRLPKFMDAFSAKFAASAPPTAVTDAMVPIYARAFSMEDIQGLIQFYESPLGQRVVKTLPKVVEDSQNAGVQIEQNAAMSVLETMQDDYPELKPMLQPHNPAPGAAPAPGTAPTPGAAPAPAPTPSPASPQK